MVADVDIGWTAGILDGEGHLRIARGPNYGVRVVVSNTDLKMLRRLVTLWGGHISPSKHNMPNAREVWQWNLHGKNVAEMLAVVAPHLVTKAEQARLLLEMLSLWHKRNVTGEREALYAKIAPLNRRGIAA